MNKGMLSIALFLAAPVSAQTIYKCVGRTGNAIYSQVPCGNDAQLLSREKKNPTAETANDRIKSPVTSAAKHPQDPNIQAISDSADDSDCRRAAQRWEIIPHTTEIESLKSQVYELEHSAYVSSTTGQQNANSQRMQQEDRIRAAALRSAIAIKEQQNSQIRSDSQRAAREALAKCDARKADRDKARENLSN